MLVIMAGLPASGKTTLARALARAAGGVVLDKDAIRPALFPAEDIEYSAAQDDFVMELMLRTARYLLEKNAARVVFLDGRTFSRAYQRQRAIDFAEAFGTPWRIIECVCSEASAHARLTEDLSAGRHPAANRTFELWASVRDSFEPIPAPKVVIDTDRPFEECLQEARTRLT
jgi:predicted kinase